MSQEPVVLYELNGARIGFRDGRFHLRYGPPTLDFDGRTVGHLGPVPVEGLRLWEAIKEIRLRSISMGPVAKDTVVGCVYLGDHVQVATLSPDGTLSLAKHWLVSDIISQPVLTAMDLLNGFHHPSFRMHDNVIVSPAAEPAEKPPEAPEPGSWRDRLPLL